MIRVVCPRCRQLLVVSEQDIGVPGHCARCKGHITILDALEPVPHEEAPPAPLASEDDHEEWDRILRDPNKVLRTQRANDGIYATSLPHLCLTNILINLNQLVYLFRYKRNEIPDKPEFAYEREERAAWEEKMGSFGYGLLDNNIERRVHNIEDALKGLPVERFQGLHQRLIPVLDAVDRVKTAELVAIIEGVKGVLRGVEKAGTEYSFQRSAQ